jgi:hypothetical protein
VKRRRPFHPLLFAAYPVLSLYAANTVLIPPQEVWLPLVIVEVATCLLWSLLWIFVRSAERSAAGASVAVLTFFSFGPILDIAQHATWGRTWVAIDLAYPWWPTWVCLVFVASWRWKRVPMITTGLNAAGFALALIPTFSIVMAWTGSGKQVPTQAVATNAAKFRGTRPDVFYIILDGYGRSDVLKGDVGLDNHEFIDGLKKRGFYIGEDSRSNYCQTELSLTSSLNMGFLPEVVPGYSPKETDRGVLDRLIDRNRVSQTFRDYGYGYLGITSGFPGVHPRSADLVMEGPHGSSLFESALLVRTPMQTQKIGAQSIYDSRRETLRSAVATVGLLGRPASRPRFIFAHILAPHPPFVFGPNGEEVAPRRMYAIVDGSHFMQNGGTPAEYAKGYAGQAQTIGRLVLAAIDEVLRQEHTPPIIVIQGDHGPKLHLDQDSLAKTDVQEVFPILNAYLVPPDVQKELYPGISPVNSFRTIFRAHFGEDLPNLPDRSWYSDWFEPFKFEEVTDRVK